MSFSGSDVAIIVVDWGEKRVSAMLTFHPTRMCVLITNSDLQICIWWKAKLSLKALMDEQTVKLNLSAVEVKVILSLVSAN